MKRWRGWLVLAGALLIGALPARSEYMETFYIHGFTRSGSTISSGGDSIPFGTVMKSRWIPIFGARQVTINIRATAADSDSTVVIKFANADTSTVLTATLDTLTNQAPSNIASGAQVLSNYRGTGGTSWGPGDVRTINIAPIRGANFANAFIPVRWFRLEVTAPTRQCTGGASGQACNSMHGVRIWAHVMRDDPPRGSDPFYPFHGTYPAQP